MEETTDASDPRVKRSSSPLDSSSDNYASPSFAPRSLSGNQSSETKMLELSEPGGTSNVRNSLAWDSEFFTSSGVLDPEELSIIIGDAEKGKDDPLSGIKKETCRSSRSETTFLSENLSLESLEAELFEDIRASIKKSSKESNSANSRNKGASVGIHPKSSRSSNMANSSCKVAAGGADTRPIGSSNKLDIASRKRLNSKPGSKMTAIGMQGSGKTMKQDYGCLQITQSIARIGDTARRPNVIIRANPTITMTQASLGANCVKNEIYHTKSTTGSSKGTQASNVTGLGSLCRAVTKPALYSNSSLGSATATATKRQPTRFSSSCDSSGSASPGNNSKSRSISTRKDIDSRTVDQSLGDAIPKTSSKIAWSKKTSSTSQISGGNENRVIGLSQNIKKASTQTGIVSRPSSSSSSRLQMPSPKIGVFSGIKLLVRNPSRATQSQPQSPSRLVLSKAGGGINSPNRIFKNRLPQEKLTWRN